MYKDLEVKTCLWCLYNGTEVSKVELSEQAAVISFKLKDHFCWLGRG